MKQNNSRSAIDQLSGDEKRHRLIQDYPTTLGTEWAVHSCEELKRSGRGIEGGWPGTIPEARSRVQRELASALAAHGLEPLRPNELIAATSATYEQAKREWHVAGRGRASKPPLRDVALSEPSDRRKST
jgi:hypothetical protein